MTFVKLPSRGIRWVNNGITMELSQGFSLLSSPFVRNDELVVNSLNIARATTNKDKTAQERPDKGEKSDMSTQINRPVIGFLIANM